MATQKEYSLPVPPKHALFLIFTLSLVGGFLSYFLTSSDLPSSLDIVGKPTLEGFNKKKDIHFFYGYVLSFLTIGIFLLRYNFFETLFSRMAQWLSSPLSKKWGRYAIVGKTLSVFIIFSLTIYGIKMLLGRFLLVDLSLSKEGALGVHIALLIAASLWTKISSSRFNELTKSLLLISQIPISFLFLCLIPLSTIQQLKDFTLFPNSLLLCLAIGLSIWNFIWLYRIIPNHQQTDFVNIISPLSAFAVLLLIHSSFHYHPYLSTDDYHMGEQYLPYWLVKNFGHTLYKDYLPAHGLINMSPMAISDLLWRSISVEGVTHGFFIQHVLVLGFVFTGFYLLSNSLVALLFLTTPFIFKDSVYLIAGIAALLSYWFLKKKNESILALGIPALGLIALFELSLGISFTIGFAALVVISFLDGWRSSKFRIIGATAVGALTLILILQQLPIDYLDMIQALLENSSANLFGYGIGFKDSFNENWLDSLFNIFLRSLWIFSLPLIIFGFLTTWSKRTESRFTKLQSLLLLWFAIGCIFVHGYALGRIDEGAISRNGSITQMLVGILVPLILMVTFHNEPKKIMRGLVVYIFAALALNGTLRPSYNYNFANFPTKTDFANTSSKVTQLETQRNEFKNIGFIDTDPVHLSKIREIKENLALFKDQTPTFIDLTNHNAYYFYLNAIPISDITSYYNSAHPNQRSRFLNRLKNQNSIVALVGHPIALHDGLPFWIRFPELGDYLLNNNDFTFITLGENKYIVNKSLISKDVQSYVKVVERKEVIPAIKTKLTDRGLQHLKTIVSPFIGSLLDETNKPLGSHQRTHDIR